MRWCVLVLAALLAGLGPAGTAQAQTLRLFAWADYISPELIARFEAESGIAVDVTTYQADQAMLEVLKLGDTGFDIAIPAEYNVPRLIAAGAVEKIDAHRLPGFGNIEENWRGQYYDPANEYSIPLHWGTTSFVVDTTVWKGPVDSMALLFDPPPEIATVGMLDDADEVVTATLRYLGLPRCTADPADLTAIERFLSLRAKRMVIVDASDPIDWLVEAKSPVNMTWNGDAMRARQRKPSLRYAYPQEGVSVWTDTLVVPKGARNKEAALAFMAFLLRPENAALQSNFSGYAIPVRGSYRHLQPELLEAPEVIIPPQARLDFLQACEDGVYDRYRGIWARVKKAKGKSR